MATEIDRRRSSTRALLALAVSLSLFALATPLAKWLQMNGESLGFEGANAISLCNLLFLGNLCAAIVVVLWSGVGATIAEVRQLAPQGWGILLLASALSVGLPALIFTALQTTSVANVILLSRIGPLLFAVVGTIVFGDKLSRTEWIGNGFVFASLCLVVLAQGDFQLAAGDWLSLLGGVFYCATVLAGRFAVRVASTPTYMFVRNSFSAVVFFVIAVALFGFVHFKDAVHPRLWGIVLVYSLVTVVAAQVAWYFALDRVRATQVGSYSILSPAMGILFAYLLLKEKPIPSQWLALGLTLVGILISSFGDSVFAAKKSAIEHTAPESSLAGN